MNKSLSLMFTVTLLAALVVASACGGGAKTTTSSQPPPTNTATSQTQTTSQSTAPTSSTATQPTNTTTTGGTTTSTTSGPPPTGLVPVTTAGTKLPPTGVRVIFSDPDPKNGAVTLANHALTGPYANCLICHYTEISIGSQFVVDINHPCDECHALAPTLGFDSPHYMGQPPTAPLQDSCVLCHKQA